MDDQHITALSARHAHQQRVNENLARVLGPLIGGLLKDPTVIEIMLNPNGELWVEHLGETMRLIGAMPNSQAESLMASVASSLRTQINAQNPILECELPLDGSRFEALIPPVVSGPTFAIRKKASAVFTLDQYVEAGRLSPAHMQAIDAAVRRRSNILVVGGTGSGKTTLSNAIIRHIVDVAPHDRIAIIEDTGELQCTAQNAVTMRAVDHVDMTRLLKATMRLRPDRIIVGEVRDGAALALLKAWNTGHPGGVATVHANSATAGLTRLEQLIAEASPTPMPALIAEACDLIIFIEKVSGDRRVNAVLTVQGFRDGEYLTTQL